MQWNKEYLERLIQDEVQESLSLEYKRAAALSKEDKKKTEITKDVSAMANSAGGTIIYGIAEFDIEEKRQLPEKFDPIDQTLFSKEWLEQNINNIRPKINGIVISPVQVNSSNNDVVYVVEIPQSTTAHMAADKRYYKRYNFLAQPMEDYEVRDTMGRQQHPIINLEFSIEVNFPRVSDPAHDFEQPRYYLIVLAKNIGSILANFVNCNIYLPAFLLADAESEAVQCGFLKTDKVDGKEYFQFSEVNTVRDIIGGTGSMEPYYGSSRYRPILPGLVHIWRIELNNNPNIYIFDDKADIFWEVHADNAPMNKGHQSLNKIPIKNSYGL